MTGMYWDMKKLRYLFSCAKVVVQCILSTKLILTCVCFSNLLDFYALPNV